MGGGEDRLPSVYIQTLVLSLDVRNNVSVGGRQDGGSSRTVYNINSIMSPMA